MKYFAFIIAFLLLPVTAWAATNAVLSADSVPAYNACNGSFVEPGIADSIYLLLDVKVLSGSDGNGLPQIAQIKINLIPLTGVRVTNATDAVDPVPAYNACDGFFYSIQSATISGSTIIRISVPKRNTKIQWAQFIQWGQGIEWAGEPGLEWQSNNKVLMMGQ